MAKVAALAVVIVIAVARRESHSAKNFSGLCRTNGYEVTDAEESPRFRQRGGLQDVSNFHQFVGISTLVSAEAHSRSHCIDIIGPIAVDLPGDIAAAVRCGIE